MMSITNVKSATMGPAVAVVSNQEKIKSDGTAPAQVKGNNLGESRAGRPISREEIQGIVDSLSEHINALTQTTINFSVSEETEQIIVRVINRETDELIRQIPPEELVALRVKMEELTGIIFNKMV